MGNGTERISGQLNETDAPVAGGIRNDAGEEPDFAAQDMEDIREVTADAADSGKRADVFFAEVLENTRSHVQILLNEGRVCKGNKQIKPNYKIKAGDVFQVILPRPVPLEAEPENIPLDIIYEDDDVIVLNKPRGMVVHPAPGHYTGTLVNALLFHCRNLSGINGVIRPGIVHRLDKDTSGLLLVAKDDKTHAALSADLSARRMEKHYYAVVAGVMKEREGAVDAPIGRSRTDRKKMAVDPAGRPARTEWRVLRQDGDRALLDIHLITGRTHQIRVHMSSIHHPVLGDPIYGHKGMPKAPRLMLHAYSLAFTHPATGERMTFTAEPDACFGVEKE